jgi:hypothetical protein
MTPFYQNRHIIPQLIKIAIPANRGNEVLMNCNQFIHGNLPPKREGLKIFFNV